MPSPQSEEVSPELRRLENKPSPVPADVQDRHAPGVEHSGVNVGEDLDEHLRREETVDRGKRIEFGAQGSYVGFCSPDRGASGRIVQFTEEADVISIPSNPG